MKISFSPKYSQLKEIIREKIKKKELKPLDKIPSEEDIANDYEVSRGTVRQALAELMNEGIIYREQGRGTFVSDRKRRRTFTLGFIVPDIANPFFSELARVIQKEAQKLEYNVLYYNTADNLSQEEKSLKMLIKKRVDGVIIIPILKQKEKKVLQKLKENEIPFVYLNRYLDEPPSDYVIIDNAYGVKKAVEYLISLGHQRIGCISSQPFTKIIAQRLKGYRYALKEHNLTVKDSLIKISSHRYGEGGYEALNKLLSLEDRPTAIFATNDITAIGALRAAKDKGINIPDELSIVGFDNIEASTYLEVPLTTISQPAERMGKIALDILMKRIEEQHKEIQKIVLKPELIKRDSCKKIETS